MRQIVALNFVLFFLMVLCSNQSLAQFDNKKERLSLPQKVTGNIEGAKIVIEYGAPEVKNRKIFGDLVPYGKLWRTGANEATTIELSESIALGGKVLKEGKYALFTIPGENEWVVILNSEYDQWGEFNYDENMDVARISVRPEKADFHEVMQFEISENGTVYLYWENLRIPIQLKSLQQ